MKRIAVCFLILFAATTAHATVVRIVVNDMIHPISDEFIGRALDVAAKENADALLIELRTPGGLMESMRWIVEKILKSPVPVIVYVSPSGSYAATCRRASSTPPPTTTRNIAGMRRPRASISAGR